MVAPGGGGHAWLLRRACMVAPGGACVVALGGHAWLLQGGHVHSCSQGGMHGCSEGACVVASGGMHGCSGGWGVCVVAPGGRGRAWDTTRYGDTFNERAVRILLECILVINMLLTVEK